jgi:sugar-specific transcriptional regulator TrmB
MKDVEPVIKFLSQLGLNFFESKVFMNLLDKGAMTVLAISREAGVSRTNVYRIIDRFKERGLAEERTKGTKKLIFPASVQKLELLIQEQENKADILRKTFPEIRSLYEHGGEEVSVPGTKIRLYKETEESTKEMSSILESYSEIKAILPYDYSRLFGDEFSTSFRRSLQQNKVEYKELLLETYSRYSKTEDLLIYNLSKSFKSKLMEFGFTCDHITLILHDRVVIFYKHIDQVVGYSVDNQSNVKFSENLFRLLWESSKEISSI